MRKKRQNKHSKQKKFSRREKSNPASKPKHFKKPRPRSPARTGSEKEILGEFCGTSRGFGFVTPDPGQGIAPEMGDIFVPAESTQGALTGDRVRMSLRATQRRFPGKGAGKGGSGPSTKGEVLEIVSRAHERVVGAIHRSDGLVFVEPRVDGMPNIEIPPGTLEKLDLKEGDLVLVRIKHFPSKKSPYPFGFVEEKLGVTGDPVAEEKAIVFKFKLQERHSEHVLNQANAMVWQEEEAERRKDLRVKNFVTIDGETARDFDDAIYLEKDHSHYRLYVAIADVAHYVRAQSAIDHAAYERGTSVYFPTRAIHMLPENLSANLCSLKPHEDRLVLVAEMVFNAMGERTEEKFYEAVIHSKARLTYKEVQHVLDHGVFAPQAPRFSKAVADSMKEVLAREIRTLHELQMILFSARKRRGSLEFDLPESEFVFDENPKLFQVKDIIRTKRLESHKLIEEMMLAANEAVAEYMSKQKISIPYRIHEKPDPLKIEDFLKTAEKVLAKIPKKNFEYDRKSWQQPGFLANLLDFLQEYPEAKVLNKQLLTSLKIAVYSPQNKGHFGLASEFYAHFTSPIRRYPDLLLHRLLKAHVRGELRDKTVELAEATEHCSEREQNAVAAEREVIQFYKVLFMKEKLGGEFAAQITNVTQNGFFAELKSYFVDGFVPMESLPRDDYRFNAEKQGIFGRSRAFQTGDELKVKLVSADLAKRRLTFAVAT